MAYSRRRFLETLGSGAVVAAAGTSLTGCGGSEPTAPASPTPGPPVTQRVIVRNSDGTGLGELTFDARAGGTITIDHDVLVGAGIDTNVIDPDLFALKNDDGSHVTAVGDGVVAFEASAQGKILYGMNAQNGANYRPDETFDLTHYGNHSLPHGMDVVVRLLAPGEEYPPSVVVDGHVSWLRIAVERLAEAVRVAGMRIVWERENPNAGVAGGYVDEVWGSVPPPSGSNRQNAFVVWVGLGRRAAVYEAFVQASQCILGWWQWPGNVGRIQYLDGNLEVTPAGADVMRALVLLGK